MEKFSPFLILSRLWHHAFSSATAIAGLMTSILAFHGTTRVVLEIISLYYLFTRFYLLFYDWLTTRYQVTDTGLILRKGFITRRQIHVAWKDIKSVSESADPILRWKHLSSATLSQMTDSTEEIKLYAIPYTQLERIKKLVGESVSSKATNLSKDENRPKTESTSNGTDALPAQDSSVESSVVEDSAKNKAKSQRITRKLRLGDYFLIGFTYAQFIILIPTLFPIARTIIFRQKYDTDIIHQLNFFTSIPTNEKIAIIVMTILLSLGYGTFLSWIKYSRIEVRLLATGYSYTAGLIEKKEYFIPSSSIDSITISQNILMRLTGRYQLSVMAGGNHEEKSNYCLMPLESAETIRRFLGTIPSSTTMAHVFDKQKSQRNPLIIPLAIITTGILSALFLIYFFRELWMVIALLGLAFLYLCISRLSLQYESIGSGNPNYCYIAQGWVNRKYHFLAVKEIHSTRISTTGWGKHKPLLLTICLRSSHTRRFHLLALSQSKTKNILSIIMAFMNASHADFIGKME